MTDSTLVKLIAMISGLLFLALTASLSAAHGYRIAEDLALTALGSGVVCYGLQMTERSALWLLALATSLISWALGILAFAAYLVGR